VDARVRPARVPAIEIDLRLLQALEAQALERRRLRVAHGRLHLPVGSTYQVVPSRLDLRHELCVFWGSPLRYMSVLAT